jgi:hypothetical protein
LPTVPKLSQKKNHQICCGRYNTSKTTNSREFLMEPVVGIEPTTYGLRNHEILCGKDRNPEKTRKIKNHPAVSRGI